HAEDGIRDASVTGVQTCALPISWRLGRAKTARTPCHFPPTPDRCWQTLPAGKSPPPWANHFFAGQWAPCLRIEPVFDDDNEFQRSEERRVGKRLDLVGSQVLRET